MMTIQKLVVLVARFDDPHVPLVVNACESLGLEIRILLLGLQSNEYEVFVTETVATIATKSFSASPDEIAEAHLIALNFAVNDLPFVQEHHSFASREWHSLLSSIFLSWGSLNGNGWLIAPDALQLQNRKPWLLQQVSAVGLRVPNWQISRKFDLESPCDVVVKAVNAWEEIVPGRYFTTTRVTDVVAEVLRRQLATPSFVQDFLPHSVEYRVYIARDTSICVKIERGRDSVAEDFRLLNSEDGSSAVVEDHFTSRQWVSRLIQLARNLDLLYCCFDVVAARGDIFVLDVNPAGSWAYLEKDFDLDISRPLLYALLGE